MTRLQTMVVAGLAILVVAVVLALAVVVVAGVPATDLPDFVKVADPHSSPERVARAWLEAVAAQECTAARTLISPDANGFLCGETGSERILSSQIDTVDADQMGQPALAEYMVTLYGAFTLELLPLSAPADEMDRVQLVESKRLKIGVAEIDGRYYVSPITLLLIKMSNPAALQ